LVPGFDCGQAFESVLVTPTRNQSGMDVHRGGDAVSVAENMMRLAFSSMAGYKRIGQFFPYALLFRKNVGRF
jgi:hypothetical protein